MNTPLFLVRDFKDCGAFKRAFYVIYGWSLVAYHDGRVVRTWYGNGKIEIEAVFTLLGVRIPHIGTRKALKHHVNDLNTGIRPMVCFLNARPPFGTVYILGQYALSFCCLLFWSSLNYRTRAIIGRSRFEAALVYKPRILSLKNEEFPFLVHKLSVI